MASASEDKSVKGKLIEIRRLLTSFDKPSTNSSVFKSGQRKNQRPRERIRRGRSYFRRNPADQIPNRNKERRRSRRLIQYKQRHKKSRILLLFQISKTVCNAR